MIITGQQTTRRTHRRSTWRSVLVPPPSLSTQEELDEFRNAYHTVTIEERRKIRRHNVVLSAMPEAYDREKGPDAIVPGRNGSGVLIRYKKKFGILTAGHTAEATGARNRHDGRHGHILLVLPTDREDHATQAIRQPVFQSDVVLENMHPLRVIGPDIAFITLHSDDARKIEEETTSSAVFYQWGQRGEENTPEPTRTGDEHAWHMATGSAEVLTNSTLENRSVAGLDEGLEWPVEWTNGDDSWQYGDYGLRRPGQPATFHWEEPFNEHVRARAEMGLGHDERGGISGCGVWRFKMTRSPSYQGRGYELRGVVFAVTDCDEDGAYGVRCHGPPSITRLLLRGEGVTP